MITAELRSNMISKLTDKITEWDISDPLIRFYAGEEDINPEMPKFGVEKDDTGYYYSSATMVQYCDLTNGLIFRMRRDWLPQDWKCYNELWAKGQELNSFRLDTPLFRDVISIGDASWEYCELESPSKGYGTNFNDDVFSWPVLVNGVLRNPAITDSTQNSLVKYFKDYIDQAHWVYFHAWRIARNNECGLPRDLCDIATRYKDADGYFFSDIDHLNWNNTKEDFLLVNMTKLKGYLWFAVLCGMLDQDRFDELKNYASETWSTI
jgi:hypothetical protein